VPNLFQREHGMSDKPINGDWLQQASGSEAALLAEQMTLYRSRLKRMVGLRIDRRLRGRIDASDVVQDALLVATQRLREYCQSPTLPFFIWVRLLTLQKLAELHRHHLNVQARDASREIQLHGCAVPTADSRSLAARMASRVDSPSSRIVRAEMRRRLQQALDQLDTQDREIIALRHFEQLTNRDIAFIMGLTVSGASSRYLRAMTKLKQVLLRYPEFFDFK
jgi:RNA polymerase sigma-70 factor (ECF subfamily)